MPSLFPSLLRTCLSGGRVEIPVNASIDEWRENFYQVAANGLSAVVADALGTVEDQELKDLQIDLTLRAEEIEGQNRRQVEALRSFGAFCAEYETKVLVLKGVSLMQYYPVPLHRPVSADIDVMLLPGCGKVEEALRSKGVAFTQTSVKHVAFEWEGVKVESHRSFCNVSNDVAFERTDDMIRRLIEEEGLREFSFEGASVPNVFTLPPKANALYLLRHMASHFSSAGGLLLRNFIDWGLFLRGNAELLLGGGEKALLGSTEASSSPEGIKLDHAIFVCGLDKVLAIFSNVAENFVSGTASIALGISHIPSRFDSYACAEKRVFEELGLDSSGASKRGGCSRRCNCNCKLRKFLLVRWKYKYLPEKLSTLVLRKMFPCCHSVKLCKCCGKN